MKQTNNQAKGFTIIEVVLVLAIAGLIFLMVFLALPALQRGQRDTQRRSDLSRTLAAIQTYQSNNQGKLPPATGLASFKTNYLLVGGDSFNDPSGEEYTFVAKAPVGTPDETTVTDNQIWFYTGAICSGEGATSTAANNRNVAIRINVENGNSACQDNR